MKKATYISGIIGLTITLFGTIAKTMHLQGASIVFFIGLITLSFIFLPLAYIQGLKSTSDKLLKKVLLVALISFFIEFIGMIFKILHWPGAGKIMMVAIPLPFILFLPVYIYYHNKRKLKVDKSFFGILLFMMSLGVFSSLLAINFGTTYLNSFAKVTESNANISMNLPDPRNKKALLIYQNIDAFKKQLSSNIHTENESILKTKPINYSKVVGKDKIPSSETLINSGLIDLMELLETYQTSIGNINPTQERLFIEMTSFTSNDLNHPAFKLSKLPLINILNILTDWQNKILLIDYIDKSVLKH